MKISASKLLICITILFLFGCSEQKEKEYEEEANVSKDPYLNFDVEYIIASTRNKNVIGTIREMVLDYKDKITHIRITGEENKNTVKSEFNDKIEEKETYLSNQRDLHDEHCLEHSINKKADFECEKTLERINGAKSDISGYKEEKRQKLKTIEKETQEKLKDAKADFVRKMKKLKEENSLKLPSFFKTN